MYPARKGYIRTALSPINIFDVTFGNQSGIIQIMNIMKAKLIRHISASAYLP
jgi:hypothetical protein|tara:strand:+ start:787 stop:942 length:156 start_codon:yes stop_codon:yes gene_type:complete